MKLKSLSAVLTVSLLASACTSSPRVVAPTAPAEVGELRAGSGVLKGYLAPEELPDSLALLPPPPAEDSPALVAEIASFQGLTKLQDTPRGAMAVSDANLRFPEVATVFFLRLGRANFRASHPRSQHAASAYVDRRRLGHHPGEGEVQPYVRPADRTLSPSAVGFGDFVIAEMSGRATAPSES